MFGSGNVPSLKSIPSDRASHGTSKALQRELTAGKHALLFFLHLGWNGDVIVFTLAAIVIMR